MTTNETDLLHEVDLATQTLRIVIPGDILSTNADELGAKLFHLLDSFAAPHAPKWSTLALDARAAKMVDSVGLNLLVAVLRRLRGTGQKLRVTVGNAHVHRSFVFTRLDQQLELLRD